MGHRTRFVPDGPGSQGLDGRAPRITDIFLALSTPVRVEVGPYLSVGWSANQAACSIAGIHIVDEDRRRGEFWLTQLLPVPGDDIAITVILTLERPCGNRERMRRVLIAQGDGHDPDS